MPLIAPGRLHSFTVGVCRALGSDEREATLVADQLVDANLAGHDSHGVGMLPTYVAMALAGRVAINRRPDLVVDAGPIAVLDGGGGFGQVAALDATDVAVERARAGGVAVIGLRNSFHIGRIGHWAERCCAAGLASIHFVNVTGHDPLVAPHGGAEARFGTNPFCAAVPGPDGRPLALLDMATSKVAMGKVRVARNRGETIPDETVIADGRSTTDPADMYDPDKTSALVAMGAHKGSGLAIICELLGVALIGGPTTDESTKGMTTIVNNMVTIAIDPQALGTAESLLGDTVRYLDHVRSSPPRVGYDEVLAPGDPELRSRRARAEGIDVDETTLGELRQAATAAGATVGLD
ncbi:MAG: malate/lactate/ureidoglycolate dehydrogenase [Actinomycetota bacterium]|nr:malate/lactate/ureidoglycolate dehydrogenase [Actinomycetota bacterium]